MSKRSIKTGILIMSLLTIGGIVWSIRDAWMTKGFALLQPTPEWADRGALRPGAGSPVDANYDLIEKDSLPGILMRYAESPGGLLLLKHTFGEDIYSFDPEGRRTDKSTLKAWNEARGDVVVCESQRWTRGEAFNVDNMRYRLVSYGEDPTPYDTHGKYALDAVVSPSKRKAAILTAAGPKRPFLNLGLPGLGGVDVKIYGQRYIQVMDLVTKKYISKPAKLYAEEDLPCFSSCWSPDEEILISYNCNFSNFQVVEP